MPLKLFGLGLVVCIAIVAGGLRDLIAALLRVVLAGTVVAVAPLLTLALLVITGRVVFSEEVGQLHALRASGLTA